MKIADGSIKIRNVRPFLLVGALVMRNSEAAEACERGPRKRVIPQPTWEVRENQIVLSAE